MKWYPRLAALGGSGLTACALASGAVPAHAGPARAAPAHGAAVVSGGRAAASSGWRVVYRHHYGAAAHGSRYFAVVAPGRSDAWVLGDSNPSSAGNTPVAVRWNGRRWIRSALPGGQGNAVQAASAPARGDIWAVSEFDPYVLHWNGSRWLVARHFT